MESLVGYASDDENDEKYTIRKDGDKRATSNDRDEDDNYDNVRMEMSEESNSSGSNTGSSAGSSNKERREEADQNRSAWSRDEGNTTSGAADSKKSQGGHLVSSSTELTRDPLRGGGEPNNGSNRSSNRSKSRDERRPDHDNTSTTRQPERDERKPDHGDRNTARQPDYDAGRDEKKPDHGERRDDRSLRKSHHDEPRTSAERPDKHKPRASERDEKRDRSRSREKRERSRSRERRERSRSRERRERSRSRERRGDKNKAGEEKRRRRDDKPREERHSKERHRSRDDKRPGEKPDNERKKRKERSPSPRPSSDKRSSRSPAHGRSSPADSSSRSKRSKRSPERWARSRGGPSSSQRGYEKKPSKLSILERLGITIPNLTDLQGAVTPQQIVARSMAHQVQQVKSTTGIELPSYYNPAAMNPARYAEQIQKRRLLWGNKAEAAAPKPAEAAAPVPAPAPVCGANNWEATTFRSDQDGKMTAKFKRLMGIKEDASTVSEGPQPPEGSEILKKQEEMFNSMEMQYEVARVATHTHRGLGLGFGTFQYPR